MYEDKYGDYFFVVLKPKFSEGEKKYYIQMIREVTNYNMIAKHLSDVVLSSLIRKRMSWLIPVYFIIMNLSASSHYKHHLNRLSLSSSEQTNSQMNLSKTSHLAPKTKTNIFSTALSISSHAFGNTLKNNPKLSKLSKKSLLSRSLNQSDKECKGRTPF